MNDKTYPPKEIQEAHRDASLAAYFGARHQMLRTLENTRVFEAGFDRGWQAFAVAAPPAPAAQAERVPPDVVEHIHLAWRGALQACGVSDADCDAISDVVLSNVASTLATQPTEAPGRHAESQAARDVLAERRRQVDAEGWTPEHDDQHRSGAMARAAAVYALVGSSNGRIPGDADTPSITERLWPHEWAWKWFKPKDRRHNLVRAGALILAEIERLDRLTAPQPTNKTEGA